MEERGRSGSPVVEHIRFLTVSIGRRPSASRKEERAARYLEDSFKGMGLHCRFEKFRSRSNKATPRAACFLGLFLSVLLYRSSPLILYSVFTFFLVMLMFELMGRSPLGVLQWRRLSGNVCVRIEPFDEAIRTVVVMAPLDHPPPPLRKKAGRYKSRLPYIFIAVINIMLGMWLTLMTGAHLLSVSNDIQRSFWLIALFVSSVDAAAALSTAASQVLGGKRGVSENESSHLVALLLLAERFARRRPARTTVWLVAVGSDAVGGKGVKRFLSSHRKELKGALYLFLDCLGRDRPVAYRRAGVIFPFRAYKPAIKMAESLNLRYPHYRLAIGRSYVSTDGFYRLVSCGRHAIVIGSRFEKERPKDEVSRDRVNPAFLKENASFVAHIIEEVDREAKSLGR